MKLTRICPKCGSNDIVIVDGYAGPYGTGNNIMVSGGIFGAVRVDRYICVNCGFTEEWIERTELDQKLAKSKKWHR